MKINKFTHLGLGSCAEALVALRVNDFEGVLWETLNELKGALSPLDILVEVLIDVCGRITLVTAEKYLFRIFIKIGISSKDQIKLLTGILTPSLLHHSINNCC